MLITRRTLLTSAAAACTAFAAPGKIIDTHAHFYDPTRPQGVPWPPKDDPLLYHPVYPADYRKVTAGLGIAGVIEVEASPWLEDNQWVLDLAAKDKIIVATVGDIEPGKPEFAKSFERFHRNPLWRGIRIGFGWGRDMSAGMANPQYISDVKLLADADLEIDLVGGPALMPHVVRLSDRIPNLRMVIDHLPFDPPAAPAREAYMSALHELGKRPQVYAKISNVPRRVDGRVVEDVEHYRPTLDELWGIFGARRVVYGSNWPVSEKIAPYPVAFKIVHAYVSGKGREATENYFWKNAIEAYRFKRR